MIESYLFPCLADNFMIFIILEGVYVVILGWYKKLKSLGVLFVDSHVAICTPPAATWKKGLRAAGLEA